LSLDFAIVVFVASLVLTVVSSVVLAEVVDRVGHRLGLSEAALGILTALAADAPEISAAITAIQGSQAGLGFGVVVGSSIFNIAALLGLSAVIAGKVSIGRRALAFEGAMVVLATVISAVLVLGWGGPVPVLAVFAVAFTLYAAVCALGPDTLRRVVRFRPARDFLVAALSSVNQDIGPGRRAPVASRHDIYTLVPALTAVVLGSVGLVRTSVKIGAQVGISQVVIGTLVLAALTGLPNVLAAVRLALRHRGSAVVSEALNSNTLNLLLGLVLPALVAGVAPPTSTTELSVAWLVGITVVALALTAYRGGLSRGEGVAVIALYAIFVVTLVTG